jgi:3-hydroxyisobutyrate dehydrogenase-like beta-hydroxyacid dehydrogenase
MSAGDMGAGIGARLHAHGLRVVTCLEGRSDLTHLRAKEAGMVDAGSLDELVASCDLLLSVLVPAEAVGLAEAVAGAMQRTGARPVYADCNAIAPQTVVSIAGLITAAGAVFVDAGIIGSPPSAGSAGGRFHCSGPNTHAFEALAGHGLRISVTGPEVGQASGLKMLYAATTKGTAALWTQIMVASRALGLEEQLTQELGGNIAESGSITSMPRRARRWIGEMEEIAATFGALGLTPQIFEGAADIYRLVGETKLADQTSRQPDPSLDRVLEVLAGRLKAPAGD